MAKKLIFKTIDLTPINLNKKTPKLLIHLSYFDPNISLSLIYIQL
jgi:hypothetical protein